MALRKLKADRIFDGYRFLEDQVLIINEDGRVEDMVPMVDAGSQIEIFDGIICPGLINCHCHLELSHMKGRIPEGTGLVDFVFQVVMERHHPDEEIRQAITGAEDEMITNGIVAVGDICNNTSTILQKQKARLAYYNFIEASGWLPSVASSRFERARELYENFSQSIHIPTSSSPASQVSIVPHAPYSVSDGLWKNILPYFQNKTVSIHNQETVFENEFFLQGSGDLVRMYRLMKIDNSHHRPTGRNSLPSYFHHLAGARNIMLVHNTFTSQEDIDHIRHPITKGKPLEEGSSGTTPPEVFFCLCVNANRYIESALPPVDLFRKNKSTLVLGTDSLASNWSLNILDEIKAIRKNFPSIPLEEILRWATINGARALNMDRDLGSFEKDKRPGVVNVQSGGDDFVVRRIV